ncbi:hypothetical protein Q4601_16310 [Shewanella sp. 1_MG-2023]|uniref:hypothetical protein n=1 Tax=unclassified Shewanella TaxID=196818 RepID=UPI0026E1CB80|nr:MULTISPECIES: hypothetical protein [unclassified Shewanella]MDO6611332.1 hypothetical protein [Shewanella sp. 7_MG-2023]MDO6771187.1 hypothetical protein [Shewanella sp. 2_MG-2023]MDO6795868.1 hypothetical protein [Shewanella sp. 1_MG-2023]
MDNKRSLQGLAKNGFGIIEGFFANKECLDCKAAIHSPHLIRFYLERNLISKGQHALGDIREKGKQGESLLQHKH